MNTFSNNSITVGNTPLVKINRMSSGLKSNIFAKIESRNPGFSVKCRIAENIISVAEKEGKLLHGMEIIEATSGNTGIGLIYVGASRGRKVNICMPENMSEERKKIMKFLGAELILTSASLGMTGSINKAKELMTENPGKYFYADQFNNPANPNAHFLSTGPEIWNALEGKVDVLVSGVGTGGTITGISRYIKSKRNYPLISVAIEPTESNVLANILDGKEIAHSPHGIQGIGAGFVPSVLDLNIIDRVVKVSTTEAIKYSQRLAKEEGIIAGISSGAAMCGALKLAKEKEFDNKNIVVILPDSAERYLSILDP